MLSGRFFGIFVIWKDFAKFQHPKKEDTLQISRNSQLILETDMKINTSNIFRCQYRNKTQGRNAF